MRELVECNARIKSTFLGIEDHGIFTFWLHLDYGGMGQGYGGYAIKAEGLGIEALERVLTAVGVLSWEELPGKYIRVRRDNGKVHAIAPALEGEWLEL